MILDWFITHWIEIVGTLSGFLYLYFSVNQIIWLWPLGIITSTSYIFVFFGGKLYADMGLNVYYVLISIYGWMMWNKNQEMNNSEIKIKTINPQVWLEIGASIVVFFLFLSFILRNFTDSDVPYIDAFTTAASIVATWMLAKRMLENWLVWIIVDTVSIGVYIYKGLFVTVILFIVYTLIAILGYYQWKQKMEKQEINTNRTQ